MYHRVFLHHSFLLCHSRSRCTIWTNFRNNSTSKTMSCLWNSNYCCITEPWKRQRMLIAVSASTFLYLSTCRYLISIGVGKMNSSSNIWQLCQPIWGTRILHRHLLFHRSIITVIISHSRQTLLVLVCWMGSVVKWVQWPFSFRLLIRIKWVIKYDPTKLLHSFISFYWEMKSLQPIQLFFYQVFLLSLINFLFL